jgi:hypothetical protein
MRRLPIHFPSPLSLGDGHSIKPIDPGAEFAREAARIERLTADRELVDRIMWEGYRGPAWERLRTALAEYGLVVLSGWIFSGRIFVECRRKGFGAVGRRRRVDREEASEMAGETVATTLVFFRDRVLVRGRWDVTRGATLNTYFIGACIRHFPNVYSRSDGRELLRFLVDDDEEDPVGAFVDPSPFSRPDRRVELVSAVDAIPDSTVREVLLYEAEGYTQDEAAHRMKVTRWSIEGRLRRYRAGKL